MAPGEALRLDTVLLLEQARSETEGMSDQHRTPGFVDFGDPFVSEPQIVRDSAEHELQPASRMPQVRVFRHHVEDLCRDGLAEFQPRALHDLLERAGRHDDDVVATRTKRASEADERMHVAGRADRES